MTSHPDQLQLGPEHAQQRLVLLHGWGADADDLLDLGALLVRPQTSVVALRAPEPHPYGTGRQWYDLQPIDWEALPAARSNLQARLLSLAESVPPWRRPCCWASPKARRWRSMSVPPSLWRGLRPAAATPIKAGNRHRPVHRCS